MMGGAGELPPGMQRALREMLCCRHLSNAGKEHIEEAITTEEQWVVLAQFVFELDQGKKIAAGEMVVNREPQMDPQSYPAIF
jgi:hypothetical protein